jgi:hypothetical protein
VRTLTAEEEHPVSGRQLPLVFLLFAIIGLAAG